jgi:urate oxidase
MIELAADRYGKSRVRLLKVTRNDGWHEIHDWTVQVLLKGDFESAHLQGDNSKLLPTDTMKNTVYFVARKSAAATMEQYARELVDFLLDRNPQVSSVEVQVSGALWKRLSIGGEPHPDTFMHGSAEEQTTAVERARGGEFQVTSGLKDLVLLKTARSGFEGYIKDDLTTLRETSDRLLGTAVRASWRYVSPDLDFDEVRRRIRETMLQTFATHNSRSVQQTLYAMGEAALASVSEIDEMEIIMPNRHALLVDLSRFGLDNPNQIFVPTDEPHGYIEARLRRRS